MSENKKTLNKGLDALLGKQNQNQKTVKNINIKKIKAGRFQPRSNFDKDKLNELTNSIKKQGGDHPPLGRSLFRWQVQAQRSGEVHGLDWL